MKNKILPLFVMPILVQPDRAQARWNHHDSAELNRMTGLGTEYYNDILSYRDPHDWDEIWSRTALGFRSSAGSLNQKEFLFHQHIRVTSSQEEAWQVAYESDRVEETRQVLDNSAVELSYGSQEEGWRLGVLGEAETEKAFMDLGVRLSYEPRDGSRWQLIGWSVDTFYTDKKLKQEDYRTRDPWSWELLFMERWGNATLSLRHEQDEPVVWYQVSEDQRYDFQRQASEFLWTYQRSETQDLFLQINRDEERESIAALTRADSQGYRDQRYRVELGQHQRMGNESITISLWGLADRAWLQQTSTEVALDSVATREELALVGSWSRPFWKGRHQQHWGMTVNQVRIDEQGREQATEVKFNWSPDFVLGPHARMRFTSTWDLDQLAKDFPYNEKSFHPWGGGQASFLLFF